MVLARARRSRLGRPQGVAPTITEPGSGRPQGVAQTIRQSQEGEPNLSLPDVVHRLKTMTTKLYADGVRQSGWPPFRSRLWQRNYHEHIIRDDNELSRIQQDILDNPARWDVDRESPAAVTPEPKCRREQ
ncbi:hypothetical protein Rcas_2775 [Roseiflexus castenholzii DSM 13941]|uniref:Transposase IS200-like domain-containing protein n=1 Tax=Roseiflexus castenholzii (strain DSM 13941 / HLO8) TaxID=383372 RepID=A7NMS5_ROSCS|nr:hypothetical protein Rcas_2775 [Roseiflexus castenholzii DSM 13941]